MPRNLRFTRSEIVLFSIGNILCYIPLTMMIKMSSLGLFESLNGISVTGFEILPLYMVGNIFVLLSFFFLTGWAKYVPRTKLLGISVPKPRWHTFVWGLCTSVQIITVIWIYAFKGISIVLAVLLMKGGILILAPIVDLLVKKRKRAVYWPSWFAAGLSFTALLIAFLDKVDVYINLVASIDVIIYLAVFLIKLIVMSKWAKTTNVIEKRLYLVEGSISTMLSSGAIIVVMGFVGFLLQDQSSFAQVWNGFTIIPDIGFIVVPIIIGMVSAGNGIFASLVLLDRRENTFCVSLVQSTSIIAGTIAASLLAIFYSQQPPTLNKIVGIIIIFFAIIFLSYRGVVERRLSAAQTSTSS